MKKDIIFNELTNQLEYTKNIFKFDDSDIIGIFLHGSQNYNCDYENSDIDSIFLYKNKKISIPYIFYNDNQIILINLDNFITKLKKSLLPYYELFYTDYYILNDKYSKVILDFKKDEFSELLDLSQLNIVKNIFYKIQENIDTIFWMGVKNTEKNPLIHYNKKRLYQLVRTYNLLKNYVNTLNFVDSIRCDNELAEILKNIKLGNLIKTQDEIKEYIKEVIKYCRNIKKENYKDDREKRDKILENLKMNLLIL